MLNLFAQDPDRFKHSSRQYPFLENKETARLQSNSYTKTIDTENNTATRKTLRSEKLSHVQVSFRNCRDQAPSLSSDVGQTFHHVEKGFGNVVSISVFRIHWRHVMVHINVCHRRRHVEGLLESGQGCILVVSRMTNRIQGRIHESTINILREVSRTSPCTTTCRWNGLNRKLCTNSHISVDIFGEKRNAKHKSKVFPARSK